MADEEDREEQVQRLVDDWGWTRGKAEALFESKSGIRQVRIRTHLLPGLLEKLATISVPQESVELLFVVPREAWFEFEQLVEEHATSLDSSFQVLTLGGKPVGEA